MSWHQTKRMKISSKALLAFLLTISLCTVLIVISIVNESNVEKLEMEQLIQEKAHRANTSLSRLLYKTQTVSFFAVNGYTSAEFEEVASTLMDHPSISNILIAPGGVVSDVYPLAGNEAVIGLDFFSEGEGNKEARLAMETKQLVLGGPFNAVQGGQVIVGRLPVFTTSPDDEEEFWGIVSVTLKYPEALDGAGFEELQLHGFEYEIWRINPDNGEEQLITGSGYTSTGKVQYLEKMIAIQNAEWFLRIYPITPWYRYPDFWVMIAVSLLISTLVAFVFQNNMELKSLKINFETLSQTDSLTGIYNRRTFMENAVIQLERCERLKSGASILIMDLDHFKQVNDTYGHLAGDKVLQEFASIVKNILRPYDIFGRYGGEEFIVFAADIDEADAKNLAERIRLTVSKIPIQLDESNKLSITVSIGVTEVKSSAALDNAIDCADHALYEAKESGRNRVVVKMG